MIKWEGDHCNGCPFYEVNITVDGGLDDHNELVRFHTPVCRLTGFEDEMGIRLHIKPELLHGGDRPTATRPKNCPFEDPHGIHVEVHHG